jgi:transposase
VEVVLAGCFLDEVPERLIGDKAYDSDALDQTLADDYGIEMISPNRSNRKQKTQDGRPLRRYGRRWKIERVFAWMQNYRKRQTKCMVDICGCFAIQAAGVMSAMR